MLHLDGIRAAVEKLAAGAGRQEVLLLNADTGAKVPLHLDLTARQAAMVLAGGLLNLTKKSD